MPRWDGRQSKQSTVSDVKEIRRSPGSENCASAPKIDVSITNSFFSFPGAPGPAEVTARLNEHAFSISAPGIPGVARYDGAQVASNGGCEDRFVHGRFPVPYDLSSSSSPGNDCGSGKEGREWGAWGVFDGHVGPRTAEALERHLVPYVYRFLATLAGSGPVTNENVDAKIRDAFLALDDTFIGQAVAAVADDSLTFSQKVAMLGPGSNGSCALLGLWEPAGPTGSGGTLRVACTGDSRAVLGRLATDTPSGSGGKKWEAVALSEDQSGSSASEIERIKALHPGEPEVVKDGRVLGLMCSRAFGDGHWKWPLEFCADVKRRFNGDAMRAIAPEKYRTPPYITAEPVVTTTKVEPGRRSFVIIATDGLWDSMSSERAVELVGRWIERLDGSGGKLDGDAGVDATVFKDVDLGVPRKEWSDKSLVVKDDNAAVHLVRNALGGSNNEMLGAMMFFRYPFSRHARDDITVQVIFFD